MVIAGRRPPRYHRYSTVRLPGRGIVLLRWLWAACKFQAACGQTENTCAFETGHGGGTTDASTNLRCLCIDENGLRWDWSELPEGQMTGTDAIHNEFWTYHFSLCSDIPAAFVQGCPTPGVGATRAVRRDSQRPGQCHALGPSMASSSGTLAAVSLSEDHYPSGGLAVTFSDGDDTGSGLVVLLLCNATASAAGTKPGTAFISAGVATSEWRTPLACSSYQDALRGLGGPSLNVTAAAAPPSPPTPIWKKALTNGLLCLLFFGLAATVETGNFKAKFRAKRGILCGMLCQFFIVPFLGFVSTKIFNLKPVYGITLLVLCSSPGGSYSNWWCSVMNADLALSVAMTTCSTFLSMLMLPLNTLMYVHFAYGESGTNGVELDWWGLAIALLLVNGSIGIGIGAGAKFPDHRSHFNAVRLPCTS